MAKLSGETGALVKKYRSKKADIEKRLVHFESVGQQGGRALFEELAFCILTPQSKAFSCNEAIEKLKSGGLLFDGKVPSIRKVLATKTRFHNKKAAYLVGAREKFEENGFERLCNITFVGSERDARGALLKEVKGMGWKEASHYLRNVGRGKTIAILDRHILKNLHRHGAIKTIPKSMTALQYQVLEKQMQKFCEKTGIPMAHLDLFFWAQETGVIFK